MGESKTHKKQKQININVYLHFAITFWKYNHKEVTNIIPLKSIKPVMQSDKKKKKKY